MRNLHEICTDDGYCATVWADNLEEARIRAGELIGLRKEIELAEPPRNPEGSMWFRGVLAVIFILFAYSVVTDERQEMPRPIMEAQR